MPQARSALSGRPRVARRMKKVQSCSDCEFSSLRTEIDNRQSSLEKLQLQSCWGITPAVAPGWPSNTVWPFLYANPTLGIQIAQCRKMSRGLSVGILVYLDL